MAKAYAVLVLGMIVLLNLNIISAETPDSPPSPQTPEYAYETTPPATPSAAIQYSGSDNSKEDTKITIGVILAIILSTLSILCICWRYCKARLRPSESVRKEDEADPVTVIHIHNEVNVPEAAVPQTWWW